MSVVGTSVVVRQFVEIVRQERRVRAPANEFRTVAVLEEVRECPNCHGDRRFDVWHGEHDGLCFMLGRCRCCGKERSL